MKTKSVFLFAALALLACGCQPGDTEKEHSFVLTIKLTSSDPGLTFRALVPFPYSEYTDGEQLLYATLHVEGNAKVSLVRDNESLQLGFFDDAVPCEFAATGGLLIEGTGDVTVSGGETNDPQVDLTREIDIFNLPMFLACKDNCTADCGDRDNGFYVETDKNNARIDVDYTISSSYYCGPSCLGRVKASMKRQIVMGWNTIKLLWEERVVG